MGGVKGKALPRLAVTVSLVFCAGALPFARPARAGAFPERTLADWDFSKGGTQGWTVLHAVEPLAVAGGALLVKTAGTDPYIVSQRINVLTGKFQYILVELTAQTPAGAQMFYALTGAGPAHFTEEDSVRFALAGTGKPERHFLHPNWPPGRRVVQLRFDAPEGAGKTLRIRRIAIVQRDVAKPLPAKPEYDLSNPAIAAAWLPMQNVAEMTHDGEALVCRSSGGIMVIAGPEFEVKAAEVPWLTVEVAAPKRPMSQVNPLDFWYIADPFERFEEGLRRRVTLFGDKRMRCYNADMTTARAWDSKVLRMALAFPFTREGDEFRIRSVKLSDKPSGPANVWFEKGAIRPSVVFFGDTATIEAVIRNDGGTASQPMKLKAVSDIVNAEELPAVEVGPIPPCSTRVATWTAKLTEAFEHGTLLFLGDEGVYGAASTVASNPAPPASKPAIGHRSFSPAGGSGAIHLKNEHLSLTFPLNKNGYTVGVLRDASGAIVGAIPYQGDTLVLMDDDRVGLGLCEARQAELTVTGGTQTLVLKREDTSDKSGKRWTADVTYTLRKGKPYVGVAVELTVPQDAFLTQMDLPPLLSADAVPREIGLFCGLEYLLPGEQPSGLEYASHPVNLRYAPHPNRVTVPIMAAIGAGLAVGVMWDPLQKWDGTRTRPAAQFCSPYRLRPGRPGVFMSLSLPDIPEFKPENGPHSPFTPRYPLKAGQKITVTAKYFVIPADDVDAPLKLYLEQAGGLPALPELPYTYDEAIRAVMTEYTKTAWIPEKAVWNQAIHNPWEPQFFAAHATQMLWELRHSRINGPLRASVGSVLDAAVKQWQVQHPHDPGGGEMFYHRGLVHPEWAIHFNKPHPATRAIRDDGSFAWAPSDAKHRIFGRAGDTSSGETGRRLWAIWQHALASGNPKDIAAGIKGLKFLNACKRPEGAQVWELDLHVPDVLAAAHAVRCNVAAYKITRDEQYRRAAARWAYRGLTFIYLWNPPDRPIMRYGSIPVLGATWYRGGWYGRIVQWNGIAYAEGLLDLWDIDKSENWRHAAEGIAICAMQQQRPVRHEGSRFEKHIPDCGHAGMYCDAYCPVEGTDAYHWCLSGEAIARLLYRLMGENPHLHSEIVRAKDTSARVHIHTVAQIAGAAIAGKTLAFQCAYPEGSAHSLVIANCPAVEHVSAGKRRLPAVGDMPGAKDGMAYDAPNRLLFIKLDQTKPLLDVAVQFR